MDLRVLIPADANWSGAAGRKRSSEQPILLVYARFFDAANHSKLLFAFFSILPIMERGSLLTVFQLRATQPYTPVLLRGKVPPSSVPLVPICFVSSCTVP